MEQGDNYFFHTGQAGLDSFSALINEIMTLILHLLHFVFTQVISNIKVCLMIQNMQG